MTYQTPVYKPLCDTSFEKNKIDWNKACLTALEEGEPLQSVHVVTLKSHYENLIIEKAIDEISFTDDQSRWNTLLFDKIGEIIKQGSIQVRQMVNVFQDRSAIVVIDVPKIDDAAIEQALYLLEKSDIPGITYFGSPVSYTVEEMTEC